MLFIHLYVRSQLDLSPANTSSISVSPPSAYNPPVWQPARGPVASATLLRTLRLGNF